MLKVLQNSIIKVQCLIYIRSHKVIKKLYQLVFKEKLPDHMKYKKKTLKQIIFIWQHKTTAFQQFRQFNFGYKYSLRNYGLVGRRKDIFL